MRDPKPNWSSHGIRRSSTKETFFSRMFTFSRLRIWLSSGWHVSSSFSEDSLHVQSSEEEERRIKKKKQQQHHHHHHHHQTNKTMMLVLFVCRGVIASNKNMWWNDQSSYILTPVGFVDTTTEMTTTNQVSNITQESNRPANATKSPSPEDDGDNKNEGTSGSSSSFSGWQKQLFFFSFSTTSQKTNHNYCRRWFALRWHLSFFLLPKSFLH